MPLYLRQIMCGCFCWALPLLSCCFAALATKRKSGWGICGSSCCVVVVFFLVTWFAFYWYRPTALMYLFSHRLCLFQDRATVHLRPIPRKKKQAQLWQYFCKSRTQPHHRSLRRDPNNRIREPRFVLIPWAGLGKSWSARMPTTFIHHKLETKSCLKRLHVRVEALANVMEQTVITQQIQFMHDRAQKHCQKSNDTNQIKSQPGECPNCDLMPE